MLGPDGPLTEAMMTAENPITPQVKAILKSDLPIVERRGRAYSLGDNMADIFLRIVATHTLLHGQFRGPAEIIPEDATWPDLHLAAANLGTLVGGEPWVAAADDLTLTVPGSDDDPPTTNYVYYDTELEVYAASTSAPDSTASIMLYEIAAYHSTWAVVTDYRGLLWALGLATVLLSHLAYPEPVRSIRAPDTTGVVITDEAATCTVDFGFTDGGNVCTARCVRAYFASAENGAPLADVDLTSVTATTGSTWESNVGLTEFMFRTDADGFLSLEIVFSASATYWLILDFEDGRIEYVGPIVGVVV